MTCKNHITPKQKKQGVVDYCLLNTSNYFLFLIQCNLRMKSFENTPIPNKILELKPVVANDENLDATNKESVDSTNNPEGYSSTRNTGDSIKSLKINIVRHGPSTYTQPDWRDPKTANDITTLVEITGTETKEDIAIAKQKAIEIVTKSAEEIASEILPNEEVVIWSSPTGRTLETAKVILETLSSKGINVKRERPNLGIGVFEKLGEIKNFSWDLFKSLVDGGKVVITGTEFYIDKNVSNPNNLSYSDYFKNDELRKIPREFQNKWPQEFLNQVMAFETFFDVTKRVAGSIMRIKKVTDKNYRLIIVTHDAFAGNILTTLLENKTRSISPGQFISLERQGDDLVLTRIANI